MDRIYDVAVIGAGPSGIAAAVYAAKNGVKTVLLEKDSVIGGTAFKANVNTLNGRSNTDMDGLLTGITKKAWGHIIFDPEELSDRYYSLIEKYPITVLCSHEVISVENADGKLNFLLCSSPSGKVTLAAKIMIDASGVLAAESLTGRRDTGIPSYRYITGLIGKVETVGGQCYSENAKKLLEEKIAFAKSYGKLDRNIHIEIKPTIRADIAHISVRCENGSTTGRLMRSQLNTAIEFLQDFRYGFENASLICSSKEIFTSAQGSFNANYTLTLQDITENKYFSDQIAVLPEYPGKEKVYYIPYGSLISKSFSNLILCGRNIGAEANAIMHIDSVPTHFETGKAAGVAAAIAVKKDITPAEVSAYEIVSKTQEEISVSAKNEPEAKREAVSIEEKPVPIPVPVPAPAVTAEVSASPAQALSSIILENEKAKKESLAEPDNAPDYLQKDELKRLSQQQDAAENVFSDILNIELPEEAEPIKEEQAEQEKSELEKLFDELDVFSQLVAQQDAEPETDETQQALESISEIEPEESKIPETSTDVQEEEPAKPEEEAATEPEDIELAEDLDTDKSDRIKSNDILGILFDDEPSDEGGEQPEEDPGYEKSIINDDLSMLYDEDDEKEEAEPDVAGYATQEEPAAETDEQPEADSEHEKSIINDDLSMLYGEDEKEEAEPEAAEYETQEEPAAETDEQPEADSGHEKSIVNDDLSMLYGDDESEESEQDETGDISSYESSEQTSAASKNEEAIVNDELSLLFGEDEKEEDESDIQESKTDEELSLLFEEEMSEPKPGKKDKFDSMLEMIYDISDSKEKSGGMPPEGAAQPEEEPDDIEIFASERKTGSQDKFRSIKDFLYNDQE